MLLLLLLLLLLPCSRFNRDHSPLHLLTPCLSSIPRAISKICQEVLGGAFKAPNRDAGCSTFDEFPEENIPRGVGG